MTRLRTGSMALSALATLAVTGFAGARPAPFQPDRRATTEPAKKDGEDGLRLRLSGALGAGNTKDALIAGGFRVMGGVEPNPLIFLGLSYRGIRGFGENEAYRESYDTDMVSGALEWHPAGAFCVDPYVSADLGYGFYSFDDVGPAGEVAASERRDGLAAAAGFGLSFRSKYLSGGPQASYVIVAAARTSSLMLDLRIDLRF